MAMREKFRCSCQSKTSQGRRGDIYAQDWLLSKIGKLMRIVIRRNIRDDIVLLLLICDVHAVDASAVGNGKLRARSKVQLRLPEVFVDEVQILVERRVTECEKPRCGLMSFYESNLAVSRTPLQCAGVGSCMQPGNRRGSSAHRATYHPHRRHTLSRFRAGFNCTRSAGYQSTTQPCLFRLCATIRPAMICSRLPSCAQYRTKRGRV